MLDEKGLLYKRYHAVICCFIKQENGYSSTVAKKDELNSL